MHSIDLSIVVNGNFLAFLKNLEILKIQLSSILRKNLFQEISESDLFDALLQDFFERMLHYYGPDFRDKNYTRIRIDARYYFVDQSFWENVPEICIPQLKEILDALKFPFIDFESLNNPIFS